MKVSLVDVDGRNFPNLALMRISAWHKAQGDTVDWYTPLFSQPDKIYASKVFTFTPDNRTFAAGAPNLVRGGTGYDATIKLPDEIERTLPDYTLYPDFTSAVGFLTRGCIRSCSWCVVPRKEGHIRIADDIERISAGRKNVLLLDNNFLAASPDFVSEQLAKAKRLKLRIDFNCAARQRTQCSGIGRYQVVEIYPFQLRHRHYVGTCGRGRPAGALVRVSRQILRLCLGKRSRRVA